MIDALSPNTQAILLLTAPLIAGHRDVSSDLLTPGEYKRLARWLRETSREPGDLLAPDADAVIESCRQFVEADRMKKLLARGFKLSQAVENWRARSIWLVSRADPGYPRRLKVRLKDDAPPILYGCGDAGLLETGGLAVVGSRDVSAALTDYAQGIGQLAAKMRCTLVSGGARGVDQAAMRGALEQGGRVVGVLADGLDRAVLSRDHRNLLMSGDLTLISPFDPAAGFNVGNAMQRNKLIYGLADAALVVNSDFNKGGTWAGAVEQLEKLRFVPVYTRSDGERGRGVEALVAKGAVPWPNPDTEEAFYAALALPVVSTQEHQSSLGLVARDAEISGESAESTDQRGVAPPEPQGELARLSPAEEVFATVRVLAEGLDSPRSEAEIADYLGVSKSQAKAWILRLVKEGVLEKTKRPVRYVAARVTGRLL